MASAPSTSPPQERLLTRDEVATVFQVKARTVTAWARSGRIPATRTPGGQYRFRESDVNTYRSALIDPQAPGGIFLDQPVAPDHAAVS